jgi:hypothetical protein
VSEGQLLVSRLFGGTARHGTHLDTHLDDTKDLDLVFRDELSEGNEEADLESGKTVIRQSVAVHIS